jgi:hypothetical protein
MHYPCHLFVRAVSDSGDWVSRIAAKNVAQESLVYYTATYSTIDLENISAIERHAKYPANASRLRFKCECKCAVCSS